MALDFPPSKSPEEAVVPSSSGVLWKIIAIISVIALVTIGGFYAQSKYQESLQESYNQGQLDFIYMQSTTGKSVWASNQTGEWKLYDTTINKICGGPQ